MFKRSQFLGTVLAGMAVLATALPASKAEAQVTLRNVMHSDLKIIDPIWTTAYIQRNYGYMVYDTLFAMDEKFEVKPQMVDTWTVSDDKKTYTFTLRDGLLWHDDQPVTAEDCIASIKRWGARDSMGQKLLTVVQEFQAVDAKTFKLVLKEPYGLVLQSLGKPSSNVPFMMPKRVAETDPMTQISESIGSGPFMFKRDEWKPGDKAVFVKFAKYKPRAEPPSALSGGKVVKVDRVEWLAIPDVQTAVNALISGEVDYVEQPTHDLLPVLKAEKSIGVIDWNPLGNQYTFRFNTLHPPFNNEKIRRAVFTAFNQEDFLKAVIGDPAYYKVCKSMFPCGTPFDSAKGTEGAYESNFAKAKEELKAAGYDGTPVLLMHSTDLAVLTNLAPVAADLMRKAGLNVDMQSMDWQTLVARRAKKEPPSQGGWNAFLTSWVAADMLNPVMVGFMNAACDKAMFGWPCDDQIEKLRDGFAKETDPAKQKALAEEVQARAIAYGTHVNLGQWYQPAAIRKEAVSGFLTAPAPVFWNVTKK